MSSGSDRQQRAAAAAAVPVDPAEAVQANAPEATGFQATDDDLQFLMDRSLLPGVYAPAHTLSRTLFTTSHETFAYCLLHFCNPPQLILSQKAE